MRTRQSHLCANISVSTATAAESSSSSGSNDGLGEGIPTHIAFVFPSSPRIVTDAFVSGHRQHQQYLDGLLMDGLAHESILGLRTDDVAKSHRWLARDKTKGTPLASPPGSSNSNSGSKNSVPLPSASAGLTDKENASHRNNNNNKNNDREAPSTKPSGAIFSSASAVSYSLADWKTALPPLVDFKTLRDDDGGSPPLRLLGASHAWIQIIHLMTGDNDDGDGCSRPSAHSSWQSPSFSYTAHHAKVYQRLADLLVGLVQTGHQGGGAPTTAAVNDASSAKTDDEDAERHREATAASQCSESTSRLPTPGHQGQYYYWIRHARGLAQRVLKESRMKRQGAVDVYAWFTAFAAECSEALGDLHLAHLAYKSVETMIAKKPKKKHQRQQQPSPSPSPCNGANAIAITGGGGGLLRGCTTRSMSAILRMTTPTLPRRVFGGADGTISGFVIPPTPSTSPGLLAGRKVVDDSRVVPVGRGRMAVPVVTTIAAAPYSVPPSMRFSRCATSVAAPAAVETPSSSASGACSDSTIGNHLVPPGSLRERICRTAPAPRQQAASLA